MNNQEVHLGWKWVQGDGLEEVKNPSEMLLSDQSAGTSGVAIGASMEGNRPLLIEVQALVSPATFGTPQRSATGFDVKRLHMLLAVLEKRMGIRLSTQDVFLNITGGIKVNDTSLDLAVCAAVYSSFHDLEMLQNTCVIGEVGLGGELRRVNRLENRVAEAQKLGFDHAIIPTGPKTIKAGTLQIKESKWVKEAFGYLFNLK